MEQCGLALAHKSLCLYLFVSDWHLPFCPSLLLPTFSCFSSFSSKIIMFVSLSIFLPRALSLFFPSFHSFYFSLSIREVTHLSPWKFLRQLVKKREILCQARCCVVEGKLAKENPPLCKFYVELPIWSTFGLSVKDGTWKDLREVARRERFERLKTFSLKTNFTNTDYLLTCPVFLFFWDSFLCGMVAVPLLIHIWCDGGFDNWCRSSWVLLCWFCIIHFLYNADSGRDVKFNVFSSVQNRKLFQILQADHFSITPAQLRMTYTIGKVQGLRRLVPRVPDPGVIPRTWWYLGHSEPTLYITKKTSEVGLGTLPGIFSCSKNGFLKESF